MALLLQQLVNGLQHLPDLVGFGFALIILQIHARIAWPGSAVHTVTRASLAWFTKIRITNSAQVGEPDPLRALP